MQEPAPPVEEEPAVDPEIEGRIVLMIASLASPDLARRTSARQGLEAIGNPAVGFLIAELADMEEEVRAEAIRALKAIGDAEAVPALVRELEDEASACRWLASEALVAVGDAVLLPLLRILQRGPGSVSLRRSVHHVLRELQSRHTDVLSPVLDAFRSDVPEIAISGAASAAIAALESEA